MDALRPKHALHNWRFMGLGAKNLAFRGLWGVATTYSRVHSPSYEWPYSQTTSRLSPPQLQVGTT